MSRKGNGSRWLVTLFTFLLCSLGHAVEMHPHAKMLSPEEEEAFFQRSLYEMDNELFQFRFGQTKWQECKDYVTGNYSGYNCSNRRMISEMLKSFMDVHMKSCVTKAFERFDGGKLKGLHIIHDGILGDRRHSPRSLHAENRAIDVHAFIVTREDESARALVYKKKTNRSFYIDFRNCWGKAVNEFNGCPLIRGQAQLTGSIGWEDRNHQNHLHTSIPYCVRGKYGAGFFRR